MASSSLLLFPPNLSNPLAFYSRTRLASSFKANTAATSKTTSCRPFLVVASASSRALQALIFDCDGVILESEHLHRQAYNDAFAYFNVRCPSSSSSGPLNWSLGFYDELQNLIGGGKPKMRWYFKEHGWPTSTIFDSSPENDDDRAKLIDILQDWKTERYKEIIKSGTVEPRPGVLSLMDEAKAAGKKIAVCSAATKSSVILCLENLIGMRCAWILVETDLSWTQLGEFTSQTVGSGSRALIASLQDWLKSICAQLIGSHSNSGDDVKEKKPDPSIYITAAKRLNVLGKDCLVVEDSVIGLLAATGAGMSCVISYTPSTANQDFKEAAAIYPDLSDVRLTDLEALLKNVVAAK